MRQYRILWVGPAAVVVAGAVGVSCTPASPAPAGAVAAAVAPAAEATQVARASARLTPGELPEVQRWYRHLTDELLPFWSMPDALGQPLGNFPTFRCNDGSAYRSAAPCAELGDAPGWISDELGTEYTRMKSRQTFVYGVGYHVTGDERYLTYARAGVAWLREHAY
ncbi:MAG: hypothetical protein AAGC55_26530, partial [Myxococcota bacterium]